MPRIRGGPIVRLGPGGRATPTPCRASANAAATSMWMSGRASWLGSECGSGETERGRGAAEGELSWSRCECEIDRAEAWWSATPPDAEATRELHGPTAPER
eukprot:scaffold248458_cov28-Tisochrysis_lutea.AAC.2